MEQASAGEQAIIEVRDLVKVYAARRVAGFDVATLWAFHRPAR
jgi:hypothetical protein